MHETRTTDKPCANVSQCASMSMFDTRVGVTCGTSSEEGLCLRTVVAFSSRTYNGRRANVGTGSVPTSASMRNF